MTLPFLAVKDFAKHQHYRDRRPPWIKLYAAILTDVTFLELPEAAQAQLVKLWVLASQFGDPLPNNPKLLSGKIGCPGRFYLKELIASGFLIPTVEPASTALADMDDSASPSVRVARETEDRGQRESSETTSSASRLDVSELVELLGGTDQARAEVAVFLDGIPQPTRRFSWLRNLTTSLQGIGAPPITPAVMLAALADFNMADRERSPYSGAVFRAFVDRAARPKLEPSASRKSASDDDEAQAAVTAIRKLIHVEGRSRFIPRPEVEAMGPKVLRAYLSLGGADRFLNVEPAQLPFLVRDFATALRTTNAA